MVSFVVEPCNIAAPNWRLVSGTRIIFSLTVGWVCLSRIRWLGTGAGQLDSAITPLHLNFPFLSIPCWCAKPLSRRSEISQGNPSGELKSPGIILPLPLVAHVSGSVGAAQHQKWATTHCLVSSSASSPEAFTLLVLQCSSIWERRSWALLAMAVPGLSAGSGEVLAAAVATLTPSGPWTRPSLFAAEHSQGQEAQLDKPSIDSTRTLQEYVFISLLSTDWCQLALSSLGPYHQDTWSSQTGWPRAIVLILAHPRDSSWTLPCRSTRLNGGTAALKRC